MRGEDLIKSMNGIDEKYIEEVDVLRMNDAPVRRMTKRSLTVAIIAFAVLLFGTGFIYYMKFVGNVKVMNGKTVGSIDDYTYKIAFDKEEMLVDISELNENIVESFESLTPEYIRRKDNDSSDPANKYDTYGKRFDTTDQMYDFIGYDKLKRTRIEGTPVAISAMSSVNNEGMIGTLKLDTHYTELGTKTYITANISACLFTKYCKDTGLDEVGITFVDASAKRTGSLYSEERKIENGREFVIIKETQPGSGFMHKYVYWAEDKVIYMLNMGCFLKEDDNKAEIEAEVDEIITEWMKSF